MSATQGEDASALPRSPWIVRGEILDALREADEIRNAAEAEAEAIRARGASDATAIRDAARQDGLRDGAIRAARLLVEAEAAAAAFRAAGERELVPLAFAIAHRILGAFPEEECLVRAVTTALEEHHGTAGLRLRADPPTASLLRAALRQAGRADAVLVDVDEEATPGTCTLVHPRGRAAIGPLDQLRTLLGTALPGGDLR